MMEIFHIINKGRLMDILENFNIYLETCKNNQINDKNIVKPNAIYDVIKVFPKCIVVILCVFVYLVCICCTLCVYVVVCVYCCSYFRCRTVG